MLKKLNTFIFFLVLFFVSCVCQVQIDKIDQNFETKHGFSVITNNNKVSKKHLEAAIDQITVDISNKIPEIYKLDEIFMMYKEERIEISIVGDFIDCSGAKYNKCSGLYFDKKIIITNEDCIGDTALVHEMLHFLSYKIEGNSDTNHERKDLFADNNSLEVQTNGHLIADFCSCL